MLPNGKASRKKKYTNSLVRNQDKTNRVITGKRHPRVMEACVSHNPTKRSNSHLKNDSQFKKNNILEKVYSYNKKVRFQNLAISS